jgi:hypothetical protein
LDLLLCDHVAERFRPIDGDYTAIFVTLFERIEADVEWRIYDVSAGEFSSALLELLEQPAHSVRRHRFAVAIPQRDQNRPQSQRAIRRSRPNRIDP